MTLDKNYIQSGFINVIISVNAWQLLKRILLSSPGCQLDNSFKPKEDFFLDELRRNNSTGASLTILGYLEENGIKGIRLSATDILKIFSSGFHLKSVEMELESVDYISRISNRGFDIHQQERRNKYRYGHLIHEVKIISVDAEGFYTAKDIASHTEIHGLYLPNSVGQIRIGQFVFVHFATIISRDKFFITKSKKNKKDKLFIDYKTDFGKSLSDWTKKNFQNAA